MIICGHCRNKHETVAEVRACSSHTRHEAWTPRPGRYAVNLPASDKLRFFIVRKVGGLVEQAGPSYYRTSHRVRQAAFEEIRKAPEEAMARYGRELGYCGKCGRELTDPLSRELGIGPKCGGRV